METRRIFALSVGNSVHRQIFSKGLAVQHNSALFLDHLHKLWTYRSLHDVATGSEMREREDEHAAAISTDLALP